MSNKQKIVNNLIDDWQQQMQECINDPRIAELMIDYYAKFQSNIEQATQSFTNESSNDGSNSTTDTGELNMRIEKLEIRLALLEKLLANAFK